MKYLWLIILGLLCTGCTTELPPEDLQVRISNWEHRPIMTTDWKKGTPDTIGHFEIKLEAVVSGQPAVDRPYGLMVAMMASSVARWDGQVLGANGMVGTSKSTEAPGQLDYLYFLPDSLLTVGKHQLLLEVSNFHSNGKIRFYNVFVADYLQPVVNSVITAAYLHIYAGCFLIIGLYFCFRFMTNRKDWSLLAFAVICLSFFALLILEYIRSYYFYPYPWHFTRLRIILLVSYMVSAGLPVFFAIRFRFQYLYVVILSQLSIFCLLFAFSGYGLDPVTNGGMIIGFLFASGICGWAVANRQRGSGQALFGVLPVTIALIIGYRYYDFVLYAGFSYLVLTIMGSLAISERRDRREREEALLLSSRLRLELLQKSIQPHFLMNSIASAVDWIEENPPKGVELLLSLSEEFDLLLEVSERKLIPLEQEIALCRAHLKVMGFRKLQQYELVTEGCNPVTLLPPAIILTLVENGISHHSGTSLPGLVITFRISQEATEKGRLFRFLASDEAKKDIAEKVVKGTGLRYIEARLKESYGDDWDLLTGPVEGGWETCIRMG